MICRKSSDPFILLYCKANGLMTETPVVEMRVSSAHWDDELGAPAVCPSSVPSKHENTAAYNGLISE